jgi:hypothetical protein
VEGLLQPDLHVIAQVSAPARARAPATAAKGAAEDRLENVAQVTEIGTCRRDRRHPCRS